MTKEELEEQNNEKWTKYFFISISAFILNFGLWVYTGNIFFGAISTIFVITAAVLSFFL